MECSELKRLDNIDTLNKVALHLGVRQIRVGEDCERKRAEIES